ncbi:MAG TPA: L-idonate 5-dehydrogenase [Candidatus Brachybacterium intestinipullorum]|uniref:L-idonate 5-dehydrogenase n=1 Tax=Candidatus Brachybacterium intestinipullorum TaxID=2838512 RepID=A0A9D2Q0Y9_9MICO|nr:L-idonate 5-dehydrogenase [Candidatus Brachybacterium intestinipullorum]
MHSLEIHAPGDLRLVEREEVSPGPGQVRLAVEYGGICGSDLGYWSKGISGTAVMKRPFVLGHEISGHVAELGEGVTGLAVGQGVTVHPARTRSPLPAELVGRENLHPDLTYFGSAAQDPHTDGAFAQSLIVDADQIVPLPEGLPTRRAVLAEPLGVAMHAVARAGELEGRHVLISGCGPVGLLVVLAARAAGAAHITAVDLAEDARERALALGADAVSDTTEGMDPAISVAFEASGAPASLDGIFRHIARAAIVVQVGNLPPTPVSVTLGPVVSKELEYRGTYRFVTEIEQAVELLVRSEVAEQVISDEFALEDAQAAFEAAAGRGSSKVVLRIS